MRQYDRRVQIHDDPAGLTDRRPVPPHHSPRRGPSRADRGDRHVGVGGERLDQPRHRRIRRDSTEQVRLRPHHREIGEAVTAERDRHRQVEDNLAGIMPGTRRSPLPQHR
jgi:hypothetical protein